MAKTLSKEEIEKKFEEYKIFVTLGDYRKALDINKEVYES